MTLFSTRRVCDFISRLLSVSRCANASFSRTRWPINPHQSKSFVYYISVTHILRGLCCVCYEITFTLDMSEWSVLLSAGPGDAQLRWPRELNIKFFISFGPRVWRKSGEAQNPCCLNPVWSFHSQWWFGLPCHLLVLVHCVFWSPQSTQPYTRTFLSKLAWPEPHRESMGYCQQMRDTRPNNADDLKAAIRASCASLHLSSATGWSPPCHAALM